jgi:hypothetical protein
MVQSAEVRDGSDPAVSSDDPRERGVFAQRQVRAGAIVVVSISPEHAAQMRLAKDNYVIQTLSSN